LVLAPTRELAAQIGESFRNLARFVRPSLSLAVVFGGVPARPQIDRLARGLDHMGEGKVDLRATEILVLDEADHMLDLGFIVPIRRIVAKLPKKRQTLLFSATMPKEIAGLADDMLVRPVEVRAAP